MAAMAPDGSDTPDWVGNDWESILDFLRGQSASLDPVARALLEQGRIGEPYDDDETGLTRYSQALRTRADALDSQSQRLQLVANLLDSAIEGDNRGRIHSILDPEEIRDASALLLKNARGRVSIWDGVRGCGPLITGELAEAREDATNRGVEMRIIFDEGALHESRSAEEVERSLAGGPEVRIIQQLPLCMLLRDGEEALLVTPGPEGPIMARRVLLAALVALLHGMFDRWWQQAMPVSLRQRRKDSEQLVEEPTSETLQLIGMLSRGLTDQAIAREMGVSQRTAARRVADLSELLEAQSRFQLGVQAARRGWVH